MGRWSTYRRRGGGAHTDATLITITELGTDFPNSLFVYYSAAIDATDFNITDFATAPDSFQPNVVGQDGFNSLQLDFVVDISTQTKLQYTGTVAGVLTPQTVDYP